MTFGCWEVNRFIVVDSNFNNFSNFSLRGYPSLNTKSMNNFWFPSFLTSGGRSISNTIAFTLRSGVSPLCQKRNDTALWFAATSLLLDKRIPYQFREFCHLSWRHLPFHKIVNISETEGDTDFCYLLRKFPNLFLGRPIQWRYRRVNPMLDPRVAGGSTSSAKFRLSSPGRGPGEGKFRQAVQEVVCLWEVYSRAKATAGHV